jgi:hypothetical protein
MAERDIGFQKACFDGGRGMIRGWVKIPVPYSILGVILTARLLSFLSAARFSRRKNGSLFCTERVP